MAKGYDVKLNKAGACMYYYNGSRLALSKIPEPVRTSLYNRGCMSKKQSSEPAKYSGYRYTSAKKESLKKLTPKQRTDRASPPRAVRGCTEQTTSKYTKSSRKAPSFPANECCGQIFRGHDGEMYLSKVTKGGYCRWIKQPSRKLVR